MLQLRQRVIAACHIGPMDLAETQAYIEHRLTKVGWKGNPTFKSEAYDAVYRATGGIPRRINSVCDRVLLAGYLAGKQEFERQDVDDVAREMNEETFATPNAAGAVAAVPRGVDSPLRVARDKGVPASATERELELDTHSAGEASRVIAGLRHTDIEARLDRLEGQAAKLLALVQQLLDSARVRRERERQNGSE
jgi:hypothetical protein